VGFAYVVDRDQAIVYEVGCFVHPDAWASGVGPTLLAWAEERAQALSDQAPPDVKTVLQIHAYPDETALQQWVTQAGYAKVREWLHMVTDLTAPPPEPTLPAGLVIRAMDLDNDWDLVGPAMDAAFADHWGTLPVPAEDEPTDEEAEEDDEDEDEDEEPTDDSYSNAPGFCFVALDGDVAVGGILCNAKLVERTDTGRVGSLFVRPTYRRAGLGRALMLTAFQPFWQAGLRRIILDTDAASFADTPRFYSNLGLREYRRESLYEKELRPGRDLRRLNL
jgi:mycothiol synthase